MKELEALDEPEMAKNDSTVSNLSLVKVQSKLGTEYFIRENQDLEQIDEGDDFESCSSFDDDSDGF